MKPLIRQRPPPHSLPRSPLSSLLLLFVIVLVLLAQTTHAFENDFSAYPSGSQACLYAASNSSGCTGDTGAEVNSCLCTNGGNFIYDTASCVAKSSPSDLKTVYATLENNCAGTGVTISVGEEAFLAQAAAATSTTSASTATATATGTGTTTSSTGTGTSTSTSTSSPTSTSTATSEGLSTGAKVGIGAGIALGGVALILAGVFIWVYSRRRRPSAGKTNGAYALPGDSPPPFEGTEYASTYGGGTHASPHPSSAIPLSATDGWSSPATANMYYKPQDIQQTTGGGGGGGGGAGQPLLAELGNEGSVAPVELYAPHHPAESLSPGTQTYGHGGSGGGFHAELPAGIEGARYQSPPGTHSPYSPPYERSNF